MQSPEAPRLRWRLPFLLPGLVCLLAGSWGGLLRMVWSLPVPHANWITHHGPVMIGGFLGTLIAVELAVALGRAWGYAIPAASGAAGILLLSGFPAPLPAALFLSAGIGLTVLFLAFLRRQFSWPVAVMGLGAILWSDGAGQWLLGAAFHETVWAWTAFILITVAGERLELTRFLPASPWRTAGFALGIGLVLPALFLAPPWNERLVGAAFACLGLVLLRYDIARLTVGKEGREGFTAVCLLGAYAWLLAAGGLLLAGAPIDRDGLLDDAVLHAIFLGTVFPIIFGHAPIIAPTVLGIDLPYRSRFYLHLALLHLSLIVRLAGDLTDRASWRQWGGLLNAAALALFLINTLTSAARRRRPDHPAHPPS